MLFLKKLFGFAAGKNTGNPDGTALTSIANELDPLIEQTAQDIFYKYNTRLLVENVTFIVFAVWGAKKDGALTDDQLKINAEINPVIDTLMKQIALKSPSPQQDYAIRYLIRSLFIAKIVFLIELAHLKICEQQSLENGTDEKILPRDFFEGFFEQDNERWNKWFGGDRGRRW